MTGGFMRINFVQEIIDRLRHKIPSLKTLVKKKYGYMTVNASSINTLILGSSHLACGFRAGEGEFNFASPSQDLYYAYNLYKKYNTEFVKDIILSFSVFTPGHILIRTKMSKYCILYKLLFDIDYQDKEIAQKQGLYKLEKSYRKEIERYINKEKPVFENYCGNMSEYPEDEFNRKKIKEQALKHYKNNQRKNNQIDFLVKLIDETSINNQNLYIVIPPAEDEYRSYLPESRELFSKLYKVCEGYKNVKILNFYNSKEFKHSDFCDGHHLKLQGAEKLTQLIWEKRGRGVND